MATSEKFGSKEKVSRGPRKFFWQESSMVNLPYPDGRPVNQPLGATPPAVMELAPEDRRDREGERSRSASGRRLNRRSHPRVYQAGRLRLLACWKPLRCVH